MIASRRMQHLPKFRLEPPSTSPLMWQPYRRDVSSERPRAASDSQLGCHHLRIAVFAHLHDHVVYLQDEKTHAAGLERIVGTTPAAVCMEHGLTARAYAQAVDVIGGSITFTRLDRADHARRSGAGPNAGVLHHGLAARDGRTPSINSLFERVLSA